MKAVLDTNVIVSGIFFGGVPRAILEAWEEGCFELILSPEIFGEYLDTCEELATSRPNLRFREILLRLIGESTLVPDIESEEGITRDPDDDKFMLTARESGAEVGFVGFGPSEDGCVRRVGSPESACRLRVRVADVPRGLAGADGM